MRSFNRIAICAVALQVCAWGLTYRLLSAQSAEEIIAGADGAEKFRESNLLGYKVTEHYQIYPLENDDPVGDAVYSVDYTRGKGKTYQSVGVPVFTKPFIKGGLERMIAGQQRASQPDFRSTILITRDNYTMTLLDQSKEPKPSFICDLKRPKRETRVLAIKPIHPGIQLLDGFVWVDTHNFHLVRIEGRFSESPNFFVGRPLLERDYKDIEGFAMAYSSCQISEGIPPLPHHRSQITYENYTLQH